MWGVWILMLACVSLGASQNRNVDYRDYDYPESDIATPEANSRYQPSASALVPQLIRRPIQPAKKTRPQGTTPVPIITDIRRVDPHTGAFYYHYAGGDGSMKHEVRFSNGTVLGNYTYVKENGELETHTYHHGLGSNIVDNDNGNYDLHRHLEEAYVHQSGPDPVEELFPEETFLQPNSVRIQSHRPLAQQPQRRPVARPKVRVQAIARPFVPFVQEPVPSSFSDPQPVQFSFQDESSIHFNPNAVDDHQTQASSLQPVVQVSSFSDPQPVQFSFQDESSIHFNPNAVDDHQAQASSLQPVVQDVPQSQDQQLEPVPVSGQ